MEHIDVSNQSLAAQDAEINRFVIRTTDLKDPVLMKISTMMVHQYLVWSSPSAITAAIYFGMDL